MLRPALLLLSIGLHAVNMAAAVKVEKTEYRGWANCYRVSNGEIEVMVTSDVGPRIIRFGFVGGPNLFKEFPDQLGRTGEEKFQLRGGDRVWKAPEDPIATWAPDNVPVDVRVTPNGLIAREPIEPLTNLQKEIEISMAPLWHRGDGVSPDHQPVVVCTRVCPLGFDDDGARRNGRNGVPSARQASYQSRGHEPSGDVGLHRPFRSALEIHKKVHDAPSGSQEQ